MDLKRDLKRPLPPLRPTMDDLARLNASCLLMGLASLFFFLRSSGEATLRRSCFFSLPFLADLGLHLDEDGGVVDSMHGTGGEAERRDATEGEPLGTAGAGCVGAGVVNGRELGEGVCTVSFDRSTSSTGVLF